MAVAPALSAARASCQHFSDSAAQGVANAVEPSARAGLGRPLPDTVRCRQRRPPPRAETGPSALSWPACLPASSVRGRGVSVQHRVTLRGVSEKSFDQR